MHKRLGQTKGIRSLSAVAAVRAVIGVLISAEFRVD